MTENVVINMFQRMCKEESKNKLLKSIIII